MTHYIYKENNEKLAPVLLLHSTGGDEEQLIPLAEKIAPHHPILSIRGRVNENGINRYFKLRGPGFTKENFDLESLELESRWLKEKIISLAKQFDLDSKKFIVIGYSNGANVSLYLNLIGQFIFDKIIAFHPMQIADISQPVFSTSQIFLTNDDHDPIISPENFSLLLNDLEKTGSSTEVFKSNQGHQLTQEEIEAAKTWLEKQNYNEAKGRI